MNIRNRAANQSDQNELDGLLQLGMQRECLTIAKRKLSRGILDTHTFCQCVEVVLIQANKLKPWVAWVEAAYDRLPHQTQQQVQNRMFWLFVSVKDWKSAERYIPERTSDPTDLLFSMWTLLNLRRDSEAAGLYRRCRRIWRRRIKSNSVEEVLDPDKELDNAALIEAMASYLAQAGQWKDASLWWSMGQCLSPFAENAWEGLLKLHAVKAIQIGKEAIEVAEKTGLGYDDVPLMLPGLRKSGIEEFKHRFQGFKQHLFKVVPETELWRFGVA